MRYYSISIGGEEIWTSYVAGKTIGGALNIELDLPICAYDVPSGQGILKVWGVALSAISQANNLTNKPITISGGMQKGLPLANPAQAGLLLSGSIQQAWGNYQGTEQSLDFIIYPSLGTQDTPSNIVINWLKGQSMRAALQQTLAIAYPGYAVTININSNLIFDQDYPAYFQTLGQFAKVVNDTSRNIIQSPTYLGVKIAIKDNQITVFDGTVQPPPAAIQYNDLIGQPTWLSLSTISFKVVMRADLHVGQYITMPKTLATSNQQSNSYLRTTSIFRNTYLITSIRHVGNFRQPDANSWATIIEAVILPVN